MKFIDNTGAYGAFNKFILLKNVLDNSLATNVWVYQIVTAFNRQVIQGRSSDFGDMKVQGYNSGDILFATGPVFVETRDSRLALRNGSEQWASGSASFDATREEDTLSLTPVSGSFPLVCDIDLMASDLTLRMQYESAFPETPTATALPFEPMEVTYTMSDIGSEYRATITADSLDHKDLWIDAIDADSQSFFFPLSLTLTEVDPLAAQFNVESMHGDCELESDGLQLIIDRAAIISSLYPVRRDGLSSGAIQAGMAHSVRIYPDGNLPSDAVLSVRYADSDLGTTKQSVAAENLKLYYWNEVVPQWELVGGAVDTAQQLVTAAVSQPGVYGLFADAGAAYGCGDMDGSGQVDITDAVYLVNYIFADGPAPVDEAGGDINCSGQTDITDAVYLVNFIFSNGPPPCDACP